MDDSEETFPKLIQQPAESPEVSGSRSIEEDGAIQLSVSDEEDQDASRSNHHPKVLKTIRRNQFYLKKNGRIWVSITFYYITSS